MTVPIDLDALLAETRWLSGLARQLVPAGQDPEDLVQETMRTACEHPPAPGRSLRGWMRTVLISRTRDGARSQRARVARELAVVTSPDAPSTLDVVAKAELHRRLVGTVLALDEPYRSCLLLRFFENLPPREIARQTQVPIATVHSRLQRALAKVRERLVEADGPRWPLALAPLLRRNPLPSLLLGVSLVNVFGKLVVGIAAVAVAALVWNSWGDPSQPLAPVPAATDDAPNAIAAGVATPGNEVALERTTAVAAIDAPTEEATGGAVPAVLRGRVIDVHGGGVAGVALTAGGHTSGSTSAALATSGADGAFELEAMPRAHTVVSADSRWATVLAGSTRIQTDKLSTVVVAPRIDLGGRVVDGGGRPLPGAAVTVHLPSHLGADLDILLDYSIALTWRAVCDADGRFSLPGVPAVAEGRLSATLGGFLPQFVELPPATTTLLELVLHRPEASAVIVEGMVVDVWGAGVRGARVSAGRLVSRTDDRGSFTIDLSTGGHLDRIVAIAAGMQPAVFTPEHDASGQPIWPERVLLQLGSAPLSIRGTVTDRQGHPLEGAKVWIADPLVVGQENDVVLAETLLGREDRPFWAFVLSDGSGRFRLDGLLDRAYEVRALEPVSLAAATLSGVRAGETEVALQLNTASHPELRGRIVTRDGGPVADVTVNLQRPALEVRVPGGTRDEWAASAPVRTNADGEFSFRNVPTEGVEVFAIGDTIQFAGRMLEPGIDPLAFDLTVDRRMHLQIELATPTDRADRVRVLDADGRAMLLRVMRGQSANTNRAAELKDGRSEVLSLGEGATTAVFLRAGSEVGRMPLQLTFGQVNKVIF